MRLGHAVPCASTGLNAGTEYGFRVAAKNPAGTGAGSATVTVSTQVATDRITITSAKWKAGDFRVVGTGDYSIRLRTNVPPTNPGRIIVKSTGGGVAGPFTVTNG